MGRRGRWRGEGYRESGVGGYGGGGGGVKAGNN